MELILASGSPRRLELLRQIGLEPRVVVSRGEEEKNDATPEQLVLANALAKGREVRDRLGDRVPILAADTVVALDGEILGKPRDRAEAARMLRKLSGRTHRVLTGMALFFQGQVRTHVETTKVEFSPLSEKDIAWYIATGEPLDKAGAYGIQGKAALFIPSIQGSYTNVVGLPLAPLKKLFAELDVTRHDTLSDPRDASGGTAPGTAPGQGT